MHIHFVFPVKYRQALITSEWEERLYKYITGIVQNNGHKMLAINAAYDHIHLFVGLNPKQSISELMQLVKGDSSEFVNKERFTHRKFYWQEGYGAFSHSHSQIDTVIKYIFNQKEHHAQKTLRTNTLRCRTIMALTIMTNICLPILRNTGSRYVASLNAMSPGFK